MFSHTVCGIVSLHKQTGLQTDHRRQHGDCLDRFHAWLALP